MKKRDFYVRRTILQQGDLKVIHEYQRFMDITESRAIKELCLLGYMLWRRMMADVQRKTNNKESK